MDQKDTQNRGWVRSGKKTELSDYSLIANASGYHARTHSILVRLKIRFVHSINRGVDSFLNPGGLAVV